MALAAYPTDRLVGTPLALTTPGVGAPSPQGRTWPGRRPVESVVSRLPVVQVSSRNWPAGIASSSLTLPEARERLTHVQASIARPQRADDQCSWRSVVPSVWASESKRAERTFWRKWTRSSREIGEHIA